MLVREFAHLGPSFLPWSGVAADAPFQSVVAALVFRPGVRIEVGDTATSVCSTGTGRRVGGDNDVKEGPWRSRIR
jgi:hypothetical protein